MDHFMPTFFSRLKMAFRKPNSYLLEHGYYIKNRHSKEFYGKVPYLPFSAADLFKDIPLQNRQFFVLKHGTTAHWATGCGAKAVLGRSPKGNPHHTRVQYCPEPKDYCGDPIDFLIVDRSHKLDCVDHLLNHLSPDAVVMTVFDEEIWKSPDFAFYGPFADKMKKNGWKCLRFINPAPGVDKLVCELWYRTGNLFGL